MTERYPWPAGRPTRPVADLFNPSIDDALATAGTLVHYVTSSRARLREFARWIEHCPGDLDDETVTRALAAVHDALRPKCPDAITAPDV
jgi:hypothetical protein